MKTLLTTLNSKFIHSSLAIRYLKSYVKDEIPNVHIEEYTVNNEIDYILGEIYKNEYDLVCFSCYIWNLNESLEVAKNLKKVSKDIKILFGGPEVSYDPKKVLEENEFIDYIIFGEGEETFKEFLLCLNNGETENKNIKGLAYRIENRIFVNNARGLIDELDTIPFPYENIKSLENRIIYYESSRGCPFNCQYCLSSTLKGVRFFSLERIKKDLKKFVDAGVKQVKFVDRTFNANKKHSLEIMKYLQSIDNGEINFHFEITATLLDEDIINFLRSVREGLFQFEIGVQSTNPKTINEIKRKVDFEKLSEICKVLIDFGNIHLHLDLIAGLPLEDYRSFSKSFNDVYNLKSNKLQLGFLKLLKGSGIRVNKDKYGYIFKDNPPYEVLENNYMNYRGILRLKQIEEMLETYYNSHGFDNSVGFIIENYYENPFSFYEELSIYWNDKGYHHISHKREALYKVLLEFYLHNNFKQEDIFKEILKFDYLRNKRGNIPRFFNKVEIEDFKDRCHKFLQDENNIDKYLPQYKGIPAKKIIKNVHFEVFKYDIFNIENGNIENVEINLTPALFNYKVKNKDFGRSKFFSISI